MNEFENLRRELGFWTALTIGVGTMIGAGIFLLSGVAVTLTGPAAVLSYVFAGIVCVITAASAAELATGMPTSGGGYFFVSRAFGPAVGAISGIGIWLSLTFAISFYILGMGEYLHAFLPVTPFWGAVAGGVLFTALNVIGAKESGNTQVVVVLTLLIILAVFVVFGFQHIQTENLTPFFTNGIPPVFTTSALIFISFLGFVKIAAVSEEIKQPSKNLPRALIGSVVLVTLLYILIVVVIAGFFSHEELIQIDSPLTVAADMMFGPIGAAVLIFAGLLATLSSANASIMAASRINLAMARDKLIPQQFSAIHAKLLTPYRAIIITGALSILFLLFESLETLAEIASVLQLYSYAALNIGCLVLLVAAPDWYKPTFRVPGTPYTQIIGALGCIGIIFFSGLIAQVIVLILTAISLGWYLFYGRSRVEFDYGLPAFREKWSRTGRRVLTQPATRHLAEETRIETPEVRVLDAKSPLRVMVALANPDHEADLLRLARYLAAGRDTGGDVYGLHLDKVPLQTPLNVARERFTKGPAIERSIDALAIQAEHTDSVFIGSQASRRAVEETNVTALTDVAHDVFGRLIAETSRRHADLLLLGWQGGFNVSRIYTSPVQRIISNTDADVAVLKDRGLENIGSILVPWGGGPHAQLGLEFALRIGRVTGATLYVLRIMKPGGDIIRARQTLSHLMETIAGDYPWVSAHVVEHEDVAESVVEYIDSRDFDLVVIGASHEWRIRNFLFGSIPDIIADHARCSVLMVRRHLLTR